MPGTFASFISFVASQIWGRPRKYSTASEPANSTSFSYRAVRRSNVYKAVHRTHLYRAVHKNHVHRAVNRTLIASYEHEANGDIVRVSWKMNEEAGSPSYMVLVQCP